jgi:eukaryotic-like serine/threonine-protein kinase
MAPEDQRVAAALADRYLVERQAGVGGMATVYLAEDLKHHRKVAIKVLRPELAATVGPARFMQEIEIAARLQHPHILPVYDSGQAGEFLYYVMPFVEGESLRERLSRSGELPEADALRLIIEIAEALALAHSHGVVHRDIKPENVMLSGRHALVMDFGVAKAVSEGRAGLTTEGVALGTPTYMAPEQATADPHLDHRVDIYALGVMGYELLVGRPPFDSRSPQQVLAAHITQAPEPIGNHRPTVSPVFAAVLMKCLEKRPADRWQSATQLLGQLEPLLTPGTGTTPSQLRPHAAVASPRRSRLVPAAGGIALLAAIALMVMWGGRTRAPETITLGQRVQVTLDPGLEIDPALSPDGRLIAYSTGPSSTMRVFVRQVDGGSVHPVAPDLEGDQRLPRWSPDGTRILFRTDRGFAIAPALGGAARVLPLSGFFTDAVWSPDGKEIAYSVDGALVRQEIDGGSPRVIAPRTELFLLAWSPDGRWIAGTAGNTGYALGRGGTANIGDLSPGDVVVVPADGGTPVLAAGRNGALNTSPGWLPDGRLLFISSRDGVRDIYMVPLDRAGRPGESTVRLTTGLSAHSLSVSGDGTRLAYSTFAETVNIWSVHIPDAGELPASAARAETRERQIIEGFDISRDGRWLVFDTNRDGNQHIYRAPLGGGRAQQLTNGTWDDFLPSFSPDGREVAFHSYQFGTRNIAILPSDGGAPTWVTRDSLNSLQPYWSPDGRSLVYVRRAPEAVARIRTRRGSEWSEPRDVYNFSSIGFRPQFSPDGSQVLLVDQPSLLTVDASGGPARRLFGSPETVVESATWSEDGRSVFVVTMDRSGSRSLLRVTPDGQSRRIMRFDDALRQPTRYGMVARNGRVYFTYGEREADIAVVSLNR